MTIISIYEDFTHNNGALTVAVQRQWPEARLIHMGATDIINGDLESRNCDIFIIPGGASLYYSEKLDGAGNAAIRRFVEQGGIFVGICAGAYYACRQIDWAANTSHAITRKGELNFYEGRARGPIAQFIEDGDVEKCWDALVTIQKNDGSTEKALYAAGPIFDEPSPRDTLKVVARYADLDGQPPAILSGPLGKGRVILSAIHLEYDRTLYAQCLYTHRNPYKSWQEAVLASWPEGKSGNLPLLKEFVEAD